VSTKLAVPDHPILELLARRWSPRAFSSRQVAPEILSSLFEAARWTQSSGNEQPWNFLVTLSSDIAAHERLANSLAAGNAWAKKVPVLGLSIARVSFASNGRPNRVALYDVGAAMMALIIQATSMGLYVHQMAGFDTEIARQAAGIPAEYDPIAMFALGYIGDPDSLSEEQKARELEPRTRKKIGKFVFNGRWGQSADGILK
jgi:nitroreductase